MSNIEVVKQLLNGTQVTDGPDGITYTERTLVRGITDDYPLHAVLKLNDIPKKGDAHPTIPHIYVTDVRSEFADSSRTQVWVDVNYKRLTRSSNRKPSETAKPSIEITTTLVTESTTYDNTGTAVNVERMQSTGTPLVQPVMMQIQVPQLTLRLTRKEPSHPLFKGLKYSGHVNKSPVLAGAERTWLCAGIDARSVDAGESYECTYNFIYRDRDEKNRKFGWDQTVFYTEQGFPIPSTQPSNPSFIPPEEGREWKVVRIYPEEDFADLHIDIGGGGGGNVNLIGGGIIGV